jgi:hypothetical protein
VSGEEAGKASVPGPDLDTALVLGMASTALPFAASSQAEAERWLRILRLHGSAGAALQAVGVSEAPLEDPPETPTETMGEAPEGEPVAARRERIVAVTKRASSVASDRGARAIGSGDVLVAVMDVYGGEFEQLLRVHGTDRDEVLQRLGEHV